LTTPAQPVAPAKGKGKKLTPTTIAVVLAVALAGGAYLLWRQRKNAAAAASSTTGTAPADTGNTEDVAGQIGTLQSEIGNLQSSAAQDEAGEAAATTTGGGTPTTTTGGCTPPPPAVLAAPAGLSVTPRGHGADAGWGPVPGAKVYELAISGAGGTGTGISHYDRVIPATHAQVAGLAPGRYTARVRAGKSAADVHGHWTAARPFTVAK
jgi:hypothetical protein